MTPLSPTEEQQAALETLRGSSDSIMLDALAGTGKTTALEMLSAAVRGPALALAFNKSIASTLRDRFASNFDVKTMNALGFAALRKALPKVDKWNLDSRKVGKIITEIDKERRLKLGGEDWDAIRRVVTGAQLAGLVPGGEGLTPDSPEAWETIACDRGVPEDDIPHVCEIAFEVLRRNNTQTLKGNISFDDQIYWPLVHPEARFPKYPLVMVDEAQDLNALNHEMLRRVAGSRVVACGDPRQSIYGFRGSLTGSMEHIRGLRPQWADRPLTLTWRCPKRIVERQHWHAPSYRAAETNPAGEVIDWREDDAAGKDGIWGIEDLMALRPHPHASIGVLCRNNAPIMSLAFKLLQQGVGMTVLGRDLGAGLISMSKKIEPNDSASMLEFLAKLNDWETHEVSLAELNGHEHKVEGIRDKVEALRAIGGEVRDVGALRLAIEKIFEQSDSRLTLSTIHRSKGLEWDVVLHLDAWRLPSKFARKRGGEELRQEYNLLYVAETRTRNTLVLADLEGFE